MKIIDNILKFLYGSLFFLAPLIFTSNTSELFEFNKIIFIYIMTVLISFFWLIKMIVTKKVIFRKTSLDIPIILFLISEILSTFFSIDRHTSLFGYYGRFNGGLLSIISYIILYYGFVSNSINVNFILKTSFFSSILVMIYGLPGKLGHDLTCFFVSEGKIFDNSCWSTEANVFNPAERVFSTLGQPNWLGAYLAINFFIGVYFLIKNKDNTKFFLLNFLYLFSNFSFILFSRSRSSLLAVFVGFAFFIIYYLLFIKLKSRKLIITLLVIIILPILLFKTGISKIDRFFEFSRKSQPVNQKTSTSTSGVTESSDIRKIVWKGAIDLGLKYPFFGTGVETFAYSYYFVRPVEHNYTSEWDFVYNKAHNEFLNYLATTGFIGLSVYLLLIFSFFYYLIKKLRITDYELNIKDKKSVIRNLKSSNQIILLLCLAVSYITILITNFFGFSTTTINLFFYLIPAFIFQNQPEENQKLEITRLFLFQYILIFITSVFTIYLFFSIFSYWTADTYYGQGSNYLKTQISNYQKAAGYFQKALKARYEPVYEDRFSSSLSYLAAFAAYEKQKDLSLQLIQLSDYYNKKTLLEYPQNVFYLKTKAKNQYLYYQVTLDENYLISGVEALKEAKKLAPTDPKIPYSLAVYYSMLYDSEKDFAKKKIWKNKSLIEIDLALVLKKDFQDALILKKELQKKFK